MKADLNTTRISNPEDKVAAFYEREGDLLFLILLTLDPSYKDKIFFLTANTKDEIRSSVELETIIDLIHFSSKRIVEKGQEAEHEISKAIADLPRFVIQNRYKAQIEIIRNNLSIENEDDVNQFVDMIRYLETGKQKEFVFYMRKLLDNILHHLAFMMGEPEADYWNNKSKSQLQIKSFIKGFFKKDLKGGQSYQGLPAYEEKHHIGYNSIIRNACISIFEITSDCGVHELSKSVNIESLGISDLSSYTVQSLLNQFCDVIVWYGKAISIMK
jgi:hypothetical protein